ncbi:hypothetical protein ACFL2T_01940 [Elusimicrobiota bacterium]
MPFLQVRDVLRRTSDYHWGIAGYFQTTAGLAGQEPVRLLSQDLSNQHRSQSRQLRQFCDKEKPGIADHWIQCDPAYDLERVLKSLKPDSSGDLGDLLATGVELNRRLIKFYGGLALIAPTEKLREVFANLEKSEMEGQRNLANTGQGI